MSMPVWAKEKIMLQRTLTKALNGIDRGKFDTKRLLFSHHHHSHAASAFYPSPFDDAAILDGGLDKWKAEGRPLETKETIHPPATLTLRGGLPHGRSWCQLLH